MVHTQLVESVLPKMLPGGSKERPKLLILSHDLIFHSPNNKNIQSRLIQIINKGYDKPRYKYNIIKTARIKVGLDKDLGIEDKKDTIIGVCIHHDPQWVKEDAPIFTTGDIDVEYVSDDNFDITDDIWKSVIGTVGLKPVSGNAMEITALTSFYPRLGSVLIDLIERFTVANSKCYDTLFAHVIMEHELVPFYSRLGFEIVETNWVEIDTQTGRVVGDEMEDGLELSKSFELALMEKKLYK